MKRWTVITEQDSADAKKGDALWALGYLALLRLKAAGARNFTTNAKELGKIFALSDYRSVKRVLCALRRAELITFEQCPKGTSICFLCPAQKPAQTLDKKQCSAGQNTALTPFPPDPLNPVNVAFINTKRHKDNIYIQSPKKQKAEEFGLWFLARYQADYFKKADQTAVDGWLSAHQSALEKILSLAMGDLDLAKAATVQTERDMAAFIEKNPAARWTLEGAVVRNMADNIDFILKSRRKEDQQQRRIL